MFVERSEHTEYIAVAQMLPAGDISQLTDEQLDALEKLVLQLGGRQKRIAPAASEAVWMSPRPSPSQTQAPRTGFSPQQDNHTARCTHRFQAVYAHLEDSGRKADVTLAGGGLPARKRTARPRLTRMWSTWARLRRWTRSFRWGYDERPRHNAQTDRVLDLLQRNSTGGIFNRHRYNLSYVSRSESALRCGAKTRRANINGSGNNAVLPRCATPRRANPLAAGYPVGLPLDRVNEIQLPRKR